MTNPPKPSPPNRDQHAPGVSRTLEENATQFRETAPEERTQPKLVPVAPPDSFDASDSRSDGSGSDDPDLSDPDSSNPRDLTDRPD